jgi:hypothetical protein
MTTLKTRLSAWGLYSLGCFLLMLIGFSWQISIPISIIVGFFGMMINEIIQILKVVFEDELDPEQREDYEERKAGRRI